MHQLLYFVAVLTVVLPSSYAQCFWGICNWVIPKFDCYEENTLYVEKSLPVSMTLNQCFYKCKAVSSCDVSRIWVQNFLKYQLNFYVVFYSLISKRLIYHFDTWAIIWHGIVSIFLKICKKFARNLQHKNAKLFLLSETITKTILCSYVSEILKQYDVKWWLDYRKYGSVSYSFSCK